MDIKRRPKPCAVASRFVCSSFHELQAGWAHKHTFFDQPIGAKADAIIAHSDPSGRLRGMLARFGGMIADMMRRALTDAELRTAYRWSRIHDPVGRYVYEDWTQPGS